MYDLSNPTVIRELLSKHGAGLSKALGQNFLINPSVCPRMAQLSGASKDVCAIEIGPGIGVLTAELCKLAKKVVSIELDSRLIPILNETLSDFDNVKVINADVMKTDLEAIIKNDFGGCDTIVCANLPYYITSPVIMYLLESRLPVKSITVMVQKEAARRLCAEPGSSEAGAVSCAVSYYARPQILFNVSAGSFMPAPKVDSSVIRLEILKEPPVKTKDEALMFKIVRAAFLQRRKTLTNALSAGMSIPKETAVKAIEGAGLSPMIRGERLTLKDFAALADWLKENYFDN
ncbi:Ribosomal RNA small subunit methyltransferase A [[Clostridium] cellulosi]|jgi:dimethyladenosine transferase (EC 2.1.1.-)|uniref:Ribosomal RNA small subunit methyltransferase A n=1 Tax=[Clostridium] cellulosi TaxID=29343 RepID=A0A078KQR5_9FIRM|nr:MAG: 16S rRNA (adenine(1518)-N(6)/adenine(1519)-N(6))-dimethyltransferase RsmA [[Clostridium] cellulosi]CDZ23459.1 Ribosomal RNA small subunit methyltransferase A [[Clostridium] cellulosi]